MHVVRTHRVTNSGDGSQRSYGFPRQLLTSQARPDTVDVDACRIRQ